MAILKSQLQFTGSLGQLSAYTARGSDKIILRTKGGPSKEMILKAPQFQNTRRNMEEFRGRVKASQFIMQALLPFKAAMDYNINASLHKILKPIQDLDTGSEWGKRNVCVTRKPILLEGLSINKKNSLESVIQTPLSCSFQQDIATATITIPELIPGLNFHTLPGGAREGAQPFPFYRLIVAIALVPDVVYTKKGYVSAVPDLTSSYVVSETTDWMGASVERPSSSFTLSLDRDIPEVASVVITAGLQFGTATGNMIEVAKYFGAGKVLMVRVSN